MNDDFDLILTDTNGNNVTIPKYEGSSMFWAWLMWQCESSKESPHDIFMYSNLITRLESEKIFKDIENFFSKPLTRKQKLYYYKDILIHYILIFINKIKKKGE